MELKEKLKKLPNSCGVYIMKDNRGKIIYVGKAISLRKRVRSYFTSLANGSSKISALVSNIYDFEYIITDTEKEALLIEYALIKKHHPKYNIAYRDDKRYPFIKLTLYEDYPRLIITRLVRKDGGKYYGPYPDGTSLRVNLRWIKKIFPLRSCKKNKIPKQACLNYHMKRCLGPCIDKVSKKEYDIVVKEVTFFLSGQHRKLLNHLKNKMIKTSNDFNFEEAARIRDEIFGLKKLTEKISFREINKKEIFNYLYKSEELYAKLSDLQKKLNLKITPQTIEAFDVSNISGKEAVGSLVTFINGEPARNQYRRFKIKALDKIDDCAMIREIVKRRYSRLIKEKRKMPDLVLIDGGKAQLNAACKSLRDLSINNLPVIGLAKKFEHIFVPSKKEPVILEKSDRVLHLVQNIRDEAHRFALTYHRYLRRASKIKRKKGRKHES